MVRETMPDGVSSSHASIVKPVRVVDNTRLSALTNQIMELVLDNIKLVHLNKKIVDYCKRQTQQHEKALGSMEVKVQSTESDAVASSQEVSSLQTELDEMRAKVSLKVPVRCLTACLCVCAYVLHSMTTYSNCWKMSAVSSSGPSAKSSTACDQKCKT